MQIETNTMHMRSILGRSYLAVACKWPIHSPLTLFVLPRCWVRPDDRYVGGRLLLRGSDGAHRVLLFRVVLVRAAVDGV